MSQELIHVEVAYALPEKQMIIPLTVAVGSTLFEVAVQSKIVEHFSGLELETATMGVFAKIEKTPKLRVIQAGERVEIYRPLMPIFNLAAISCVIALPCGKSMVYTRNALHALSHIEPSSMGIRSSFCVT